MLGCIFVELPCCCRLTRRNSTTPETRWTSFYLHFEILEASYVENIKPERELQSLGPALGCIMKLLLRLGPTRAFLKKGKHRRGHGVLTRCTQCLYTLLCPLRCPGSSHSGRRGCQPVWLHAVLISDVQPRRPLQVPRRIQTTPEVGSGYPVESTCFDSHHGPKVFE